MGFLEEQKSKLDGQRLAELEKEFMANKARELIVNESAAREYLGNMRRQGLADVLSQGFNGKINDGRAATTQGIGDTGAPRFIPEGQGLYERAIKGGR